MVYRFRQKDELLDGEPEKEKGGDARGNRNEDRRL
jgi:hypothetical protein